MKNLHTIIWFSFVLAFSTLTLSEAKFWTKCDILQEFQRFHDVETIIHEYNYTNEKGHFLKHYSNGTKHTYQVDLKNTPTSTVGCNYLDLNQYDLAAIEKASQYHCTKTLSKNNSKGCDVNCSDLVNLDLISDVNCAKGSKNYIEWVNKTTNPCWLTGFDKIDVESICKEVKKEIIQIDEDPILTFCGEINESTVKTHNKTVVCVISSSAHSRENPNAEFNLEDINPELCTHILYRVSFINSTSYGVISEDPNLDTDENGSHWYKKINELKKNHSHLKVILSVGGWNAGVKTFQEVASDKTKRGIFIKSAIDILTKYKFDGMDIMWMWPGLDYRGGETQDKPRLTELLTDMKKSFDAHKFILTITMNGVPEIIKNGYDLVQVSSLVNQIHLLAIDYAGAWDTKTGHHCPLYGEKPSDNSVSRLIDFLIEQKVPAEKLVLGVSFIGRTFLLEDQNSGSSLILNLSIPKDQNNGLRDKSKDGFSGEYYSNSIEIGYHEIYHEVQNSENWTFFRDTKAKAPFIKNGQKWVSFDDPESVREKIEFGLSRKIKGIMAWTIDTDQFKEIYQNGVLQENTTYPLLRTINGVLSKTKFTRQVADFNSNSCKTPGITGRTTSNTGFRFELHVITFIVAFILTI